MDHFENFQGFAPECVYDSFSREDIISTARDIMKKYPGKCMVLCYDSARPEGVIEINRRIKIPDSEERIDRLLRGVRTEKIILCLDDLDYLSVSDQIRLSLGEALGDSAVAPYLLQNIQIGNQEGLK